MDYCPGHGLLRCRAVTTAPQIRLATLFPGGYMHGTLYPPEYAGWPARLL
jgi:hypothetical protein